MLGEAAAGWPSAASASLTGPVTLDAAEIRERMSGNLCRCGAYVNIVAAIRRRDALPGGDREAVRLRRRARPGGGGRRRDRAAWRGFPRRRDQPGRPDEARGRRARPARRRHRAAARPDRAAARGRPADRRGGAQQRPGRRPAGARRVPGAGPGGAGRGIRPAAEHGHGRRQPAAAHPLPVLPGRDQALQQADAGLGLPGAGRRPPQPGHPGRVAALRGHPSLRHGGGAGGA